jgi:hypothetical protein
MVAVIIRWNFDRKNTGTASLVPRASYFNHPLQKSQYILPDSQCKISVSLATVKKKASFGIRLPGVFIRLF